MANTSAVIDFLRQSLPNITDSTFANICVNRLPDPRYTPDVSAIDFVNGLGHPANAAINNVSERSYIWGISYQTCTSFCNYKDTPFPFSYSTFSSAMTNYLLPWLGLTAQLPYETGSTSVNYMALAMALGSPVLITYSLSLTVIHSYKLKHEFHRLKSTNTISSHYISHLTTIEEVLQASQHAPLRASQRKGWLSSLLVLKENDEWWDQVREYLVSHIRDFTPSALAQIGVAVVAWLLTIVAALSTKLGDPDTGLQNASGSLWLWLIPVVFGYIKVGVPSSSQAIPDAFARPGAVRAGRLNIPGTPTTPRAGRLETRAGGRDERIGTGTPSSAGPSHGRSASHSSVSPASRLPLPEITQPQDGHELTRLNVPQSGEAHDSATDLPHDHDEQVQRPPDSAVDDNKARGIRTRGGWFTSNGDTSSRVVKASFGLPILGDANTSGAAYTYARSLEFPFFVDLIIDALAHIIKEDPDRRLAKARRSDSDAIARMCGPGWHQEMNINPFPRYSQISADSFHRMTMAMAIALFVQWGTTMASFELAYLTPVVGLGCRSGSYIMYGAASTFAAVLLIAAQFCSNEAMRILQERAWTPDGSTPRPPPLGEHENEQQMLQRQNTDQAERLAAIAPESDMWLGFMSRAAVLLRISGKGLCILNTAWLLLTSIAEIIGGFDNCWCLANGPITGGGKSWIILFKTSSDLASQANSSWFGGFAITCAVSAVTILFYWMGSPTRRS